MEKLKVVIVDDEILARNLLKEYLADHDKFSLIAECKNGIEAIGVINVMQPDLIFLDIQMPGKSGFDVLEELEFFPKIIFSTAYDSYALQAFEVNAVDYLLKPYTKKRFDTALEKIRIENTLGLQNMINLMENVATNTFANRVLVQKGYKLIPILVDDIIYIEAQDDYALLYTANDSFLTNKGIGAIHGKLNPAEFVRIHRSYVIAMQHIKEVVKDTNGYQVVTSNLKKIKVSRSYSDVMARLKF